MGDRTTPPIPAYARLNSGSVRRRHAAQRLEPRAGRVGRRLRGPLGQCVGRRARDAVQGASLAGATSGECPQVPAHSFHVALKYRAADHLDIEFDCC
jgi:hypothetical protein